MDNGMESMLDIYLFETKDLLEHLDEILIECEKSNEFDSDSINEIFRIMHTVKGSSAMMQFESLASVSHKAEDLFSNVRQNGLDSKHNEELFEMMFRLSDFIKSEVAHVEHNEPLTIDIGTFEREINDVLKKISEKTFESSDKTAPDAPQETVGAVKKADDPGDDAISEWKADSYFALKVFFDEDAGMENLRALMLLGEIQDALGKELLSDPCDIENGKDATAKIRDAGFVVFFCEEEDMKNAAKATERFPYTKNYTMFYRPSAEKTEQGTADKTADRSSDIQQAALKQGQAAKQNLISVNLTKLNSLMDLMGEIVITESMVMAMPGVLQEGADSQFTKATRQLRKLTDELQEIVMSLRMVPISSVFQKMNRIVRDMSKKLDKEVQLVLIGEDTEVDKSIVDNIADPLMHVVRNSMDHGIESKEDRAKTHKPALSTVTIMAKNTGGDIVISVMDDGKGINRESVLKKAKAVGLLKKPESEYSDAEVYDLLLMPGFSMKEKVTEFSGRGVGMDVVKKNIEKIGGEVTIDSEFGEGTRISFKIPLTLAIVNGMKISVGKSMFILPIHSIRQSFKAKKESVILNEDMREIIKVRDRYYPVIRLHRAYDIENAVTDISEGIVIWVDTHELSFCIFADELLCEQQVVVKPLPAFVQKYKVKKSGIEGCAILGDGSISLILDVNRLYINH